MLLSIVALLAGFAQGQDVNVHVYRSHDISTALKAGCDVQQVPTLSGKTGGAAPAIIRCPAPVEAFEDRERRSGKRGAQRG